jgi:aminoglycoside/choline kinase family phosphotransferase
LGDGTLLEEARSRVDKAWEALELGRKAERFELLPPQASLRRYARLSRGEVSLLAMIMPLGTGPEEIGGGGGADAFLSVQSYLEEGGVSVPAVYGYERTHEVLFLEDLGTWTLEAGLGSSELPEGREPRWSELSYAYEQSVDLLVALKKATAGGLELPGPWQGRRFDRELLTGEWEHFVEYLLVEGAGRRDLAEDPRVVEAGERLVNSILEMPYCWTHRDYQSRNLMVADRGLVVIDFQDALAGPDVYDLVALLRDSYVKLPEALLLELIERYYNALASAELAQGSLEEFTTRFWLVSLHRKAKDAGRFVYIDRVKGNPDFLQSIPASLGYLRTALSYLKGYEELAEALEPIWGCADFSKQG